MRCSYLANKCVSKNIDIQHQYFQQAIKGSDLQGSIYTPVSGFVVEENLSTMVELQINFIPAEVITLSCSLMSWPGRIYIGTDVVYLRRVCVVGNKYKSSIISSLVRMLL